MDKITFYNKIPEMECLSGDTLDTMEITVEGIENLTSPSMRAQISKRNAENSIVVNKACTLMKDDEDNPTGFSVTIDSDDTAQLRGAYWLDFILSDNGLHYKKMRGCLVVYPQFRGT